MQISKETHNDLLKTIEDQGRSLHVANFENHDLRTQIENHQDTLNKIENAANGIPLNRDVSMAMGVNYDSGYSQGPSRLTDEERRAIELDDLRQHIVRLECRLAATIAVVQFAKSL